jgi:hypothetical protein
MRPSDSASKIDRPVKIACDLVTLLAAIAMPVIACASCGASHRTQYQ